MGSAQWMKRWGTVCCLFLATAGLAAEPDAQQTVRLEEVIVTATRMEQDVSLSPAAVSVVQKEEIEKRGVKVLDQIVNTVPGVFNRRGKGLMDTQSAITLRGIPDQKRTLILMDGMILNDPRVGTVNFGGLAPEDLERVEVVRGPFSSLYGGNAMGGVVQFLTRWPEKREITLKTGYGTAWTREEAPGDYWRNYASYGDHVDKWRWFVSYGYEKTNGYVNDVNLVSIKPTAGITGWTQTTNNKGVTQYLIGDRGDNDWNDYNTTAKVRYDLTSDSRIQAQFLRSNYDYNTDNPHTYLRNSSGNSVYAYTGVKEATFLSGYGHRAQNLYNIAWEQCFGPLEGKLSLGMNDQRDAWYVSVGSTSAATRSGGPGTRADTPSQAYTSDLQLTIPVFERHRLTVGGAFKYDTAETREYGINNWRDIRSDGAMSYESRGNDRTYALFLQGEMRALDNLTFYLGFRQDWWETFDGYANSVGTAGYPQSYPSRSDSAFSPKGAIVYRPLSGTTLRLSGGKAFRAPTVYELYRTYTSGANTYQYNPNLSPETTLSWEAGIEQNVWKGATVKITYFENYMDNFIYQSTLSANTFQNANAAKARGTGVEAEVEQRVDKWLRLFANYTYTDSRITENSANANSVNKQIPQIPRQTFNAGGEGTVGKFTLSLTGRYVDQRFSNDDNSDTANSGYGSRESFFTADSKVSCRVTSWATVSVSVDNILDRTYYDYYRAPGRSWFTEISFKF
jgi:iron complex outermembrane recepter protein